MNTLRALPPSCPVLVTVLCLGLSVASYAQQVESLNVHGHWVIEVRNPDGTLVERREFDNALHADGERLLAAYLSRQSTPGLWSILLGNDTSATICNLEFVPFDLPPFRGCWMLDPRASPLPIGGGVFYATEATLTGANSDQITVIGDAWAQVTGQIANVATLQTECPNTTVPTACRGVGTVKFTTHTLTDNSGALAPLPVAAGQFIRVTVTLSFR